VDVSYTKLRLIIPNLCSLDSVKAPNKKLCGKLFNYGSPIAVITIHFWLKISSFRYLNSQFPHESIQYACGIIDSTLKTWNPKDAEEIKCVLSDMRKSCFGLVKGIYLKLTHLLLFVSVGLAKIR
jgi:hypothetical protein